MKTTPRQQEQSRGSAAGDTLNFWINRSCTVKRIRVCATGGLTFSGATPHMCSQLSLFDLRSSGPTDTPAKSARSIAPGRTVLCILKRPTRRFDSSSATSTAKSTARSGAADGTAASSGRAGKSSIKTDGSTSTRCFQRRLTTSTVLSLATHGMSGGIASSGATSLNSRARSAT